MDYLRSTITKMQVFNPLVLTGMATLVFWLLLSYRNSRAWKLRHFPTIGSTLPILSFVSTIKFIKDPHSGMATSRRKWPGRIFKIPAPTGWHLVITDPKLIDDLRKAPEHILSQKKAVDEFMQLQFTSDRYTLENQIHVPIIKAQLSKELEALVPGVYDEVVEACNQYLPAKDEWTSVKALETMTTIVARAANRIFVGPILCRNPDWNHLLIELTMDAVKAAILISLFPPFLRPLVNYFVSSKGTQRKRDGLELLRPFIAARRDEEGTEHHNDFLSWLVNEAKGKDREDQPIFSWILGLNLAAIHTSSMAVTHALFYLASNPEYLKPLREELEEVTKRDGWTKAGLDQMHKLDSFVKESQRLHPASAFLMSRIAIVDYTFSDGTYIPAGTFVAVLCNSVHLDPSTYEEPLKFDGFRFVRMKERAALDGHPDKRFDMVTINADSVAFGQGRHACPGRFFASAEIKLLLAYIVMTYDVKLADGDTQRPPDVNGNSPNPAAKVYFRKRQ